MKIGLSYDQGTPKYRLYADAIVAAAEAAGIEAKAVWLGGAHRPLNREALERVDGMLFTGGADVEPKRYAFADPDGVCHVAPGRDDAELAMLIRAFEREIPVLAICRGMQLLNVHLGGTLVPHLATTEAHRLPDDQRHDVHLLAESELARLLGEEYGAVSSSHHQAVDAVAKGLCAVAYHDDGTIEAVEWEQPARNPWLVAIQWHPERMALSERFAGPIFDGFLKAVAAARLA